ncbi:GRAM domain-containing protein 4-like [Ruditapes philippinarum]|uniref:GRAM domain-containing protein 4-like n=1 Tax=Ruditapes philippinarum TaxID=129788 RepID=UPI00295AD7C1|nr:GRAM domain-containing protein 4-like [Ruditapes philippinarum]
MHIFDSLFCTSSQHLQIVNIESVSCKRVSRNSVRINSIIIKSVSSKLVSSKFISSKSPAGTRVTKPNASSVGESGEGSRVVQPVLENQVSQPRSRFDKLFERTCEVVYDVLEDFNDMTRPDDNKGQPDEPLSVKTLKENIRRFKTAVKPITDTWKGLFNLFNWRNRSYTLFVFLIHMYCVWRGWFLPLLFFLGAVRMVVNFLHFKGYTFHFAYLDSGELEKETDDSLGLSDKFNLVLLVATKVQNGLGSVADNLEKVKNMLTWRHREGSKRVLLVLCMGFVMTAIMPTSIFWKFIGLGFGVKIFIVNYIYNRYPRIKKRYDSNYKLWITVPTDAQYEKNFVKAEMDKYIVIPRSDSELERSMEHLSDLDSSEDEDSAEFRQVFSLPITECPQRGWLSGKRTVLIGKDRSVITLLSKKRGKLFLTNSFLCFEREKTPSARNIVIPLQDIVRVDKVKINQRMPGKGMAIQILINSEGKENVLTFGGVIGRDEVVKSINQSIRNVKQERQSPRRSSDNISRRSLDSVSSRIQNFTFGAYYVDSDSD